MKNKIEDHIPNDMKDRFLYIENDCKEIWDWSEKYIGLLKVVRSVNFRLVEEKNDTFITGMHGCGKNNGCELFTGKCSVCENAPYVNISYEMNTDIVDGIKRCKLNKNVYEDYLEIQKLWLNREVVRYHKAQNFP